MSLQYKEILINLGYNPNDRGRELRMRPIYRESDNDTSLKVDKDSGKWIDFGLSRKGSFEELVQITLSLKTIDEAKEVLQTKFNFALEKNIPIIRIKQTKIFSEEELKKLIPNHDYWLKRGISKETITSFRGGVCQTGKMKERYVFPIFNREGQIIGFSGRTLVNSAIRWKHIGTKSSWCYPLFFNNENIIQKKSVVLVEGIGCMLALWEAGICNTIVLFGIDCSLTILNYLIQVDPDKVFIGLNNEPENNNIGNEAAKKLITKLKKYFDYWQIKEALPFKKDFGEMTKEEILEWGNLNKIL